MQLPSGVNVLRVAESVKFDPLGRALRVTYVYYTVGTDGPFTLEVEPVNNNPDWITAQIAAKAAEIAALRGNE